MDKNWRVCSAKRGQGTAAAQADASPTSAAAAAAAALAVAMHAVAAAGRRDQALPLPAQRSEDVLLRRSHLLSLLLACASAHGCTAGERQVSSARSAAHSSTHDGQLTPVWSSSCRPPGGGPAQPPRPPAQPSPHQPCSLSSWS